MRTLKILLVTAMLLVVAVPFWNVFAPVDATGGGDTERLELAYGPFDLSVEVPSGLESYYGSVPVPRMGIEQYRIYTFVTPDDPAVEALAHRIVEVTPMMDDLFRADFTVAAIHGIVGYATDAEMHGTNDYWQYPAETLLSGEGDCEDQALLLASVLEAMGMDTVLVIESGHMLVGVDVDGRDGNTVEYHGREYMTADPYNGYRLGSVSADPVAVVPSDAPNVWTYLMLGGALALFVTLLIILRRTGV